MSAPSTVLFVGRRQGALAAAEALGLEVVCVDHKPPRRPGIAAFYERSLDTSDESGWRRLARRLAERHRLAAVFALTEQAVVPAARLRAGLGLPGDPPEVAVRCTDKLAMKRAVRAAGVACARFVAAEEGLSAGELVAELGLPLVAKVRVGSGGRQNRLCVVRSAVEPLPPGWMAESFVDGVEMSVESLVVGGRPFFVNLTEYFRVRWANVVPAVLPDGERRQIEDLNRRVIAALGIDTAWTHLELFRTPAGPVMGEIAARPPGGWIAELIASAYGFDPWQAWLRSGLGQEVGDLPPVRRHAGVWVLHPGAGTVASVAGVEAARALPGVERVVLRAAAGTVVSERIGAGQEVGHVFVTGADRDEVADRLVAAHDAIRIEMV